MVVFPNFYTFIRCLLLASINVIMEYQSYCTVRLLSRAQNLSDANMIYKKCALKELVLITARTLKLTAQCAGIIQQWSYRNANVGHAHTWIIIIARKMKCVLQR